ncbi:outer membrane lipoprotein chaperone LolA [Ectothiorhodospira mobilis]|uniref:outer membrane lipoprotein chaperone LolA n=1 Tax=Ectothiorhodospira mobilis TaxID=195064 RepID=UPI00237811F6|nr:outer membrane lipoprotein chaperone LolA [Ectothiorhodospira mobilis]
MYRILTLLPLLLALVVTPALAGEGRQRLESFFQEMDTFRAAFEQVVTDESGEVMQRSEGRVDLKRPGRFRWDYETPYRQQIIADGESLWTYDADLAQATVQPMGEALGRTPTLLLTGDGDLQEAFRLEEAGTQGDLAWVELIPREGGTDFERLRIGLDGRAVREMVLEDQFGQRTRIRFSQRQMNPGIPESRFRFEPPADVDVMQNG